MNIPPKSENPEISSPQSENQVASVPCPEISLSKLVEMVLEQRKSDSPSYAISREIDLILTHLAFGRCEFKFTGENKRPLNIDVWLRGGELSLEFKDCEVVPGTIKLGSSPPEITEIKSHTDTTGGTISMSGPTVIRSQAETDTTSIKRPSDFAEYQQPLAQPSWRFECPHSLNQLPSLLQNLEICTLRINAAGSSVAAVFKVKPKDIVISDVEDKKPFFDRIQYILAKAGSQKYYDQVYSQLKESRLSTRLDIAL